MSGMRRSVTAMKSIIVDIFGSEIEVPKWMEPNEAAVEASAETGIPWRVKDEQDDTQG